MMTKRLLYIMLVLLATSCVTDVDLDDSFEPKLALSGTVFNDTNAMFSLQLVKRDGTGVPSGGRVWIEDDKGNTYDCTADGYYHTCNESILGKSSYYTVYATASEVEDVFAVLEPPKKLLNSVSARADTTIDSIFLKIAAIDDAYFGFCVIKIKAWNHYWNPPRFSETFPIISNGYAWNTEDAYLADIYRNTTLLTNNAIEQEGGQFKMSYSARVPPISMVFLEFDQGLKDYLITVAEQGRLEYEYDVLAKFLPPIILPGNVENGFGYVASAYRSVYKIDFQ